MAKKGGLASFMEGFSTGYDAVGSIGEDFAMSKVRDWEEEEVKNEKTGKTTYNFGNKEYDHKLTDEERLSARAEGLGAAKTRWGSPEDALDFKKKQADYNYQRLLSKKAQQAYDIDKPYNDAITTYNQKAALKYGGKDAFSDATEAANAFIKVNTRFGKGEGFTFQNQMSTQEINEFSKESDLFAAELKEMIRNPGTGLDELIAWSDKVNGENKGVTQQVDDESGVISLYNTVNGEVSGPAFITGTDLNDLKSNLSIFSTPGGMTTLVANRKQDEVTKLEADYKKSQIAKNYIAASKPVQDKAREAWMSTLGKLITSSDYITLHKQASSQSDPGSDLWKQLAILRDDSYKSFEKMMEQYDKGLGSKNKYTGFSGTEVK